MIPMKTKVPVDRNSLMSLNIPDTAGALTAGNIHTLNHSGARGQTSGLTGQTNVPERSASFPPSGRTRQIQNDRAGQTSGSSAARGHSAARSPSMATGPRSVRPDSSAAAPVPETKRLPALTKPVCKGQKTVLFADGTIPSVRACFGWNTTDARCDVDVSAFLLNADGKVPGDSWFVFYGQTVSPDGSTRFYVTDTSDREMITVDFTKLNPGVSKIVFVLTINDAFARKLHFDMLKDAYIRILDSRDTELASFKMTDYYPNVISMMIGELYRHNSSWKFHAIGNGVARDLAGLCALYGVEVAE